MNNTEALRLIADIGPEAHDVLHSWLALQWAHFWVMSFLCMTVVVIGVGVVYKVCKDTY